MELHTKHKVTQQISRYSLMDRTQSIIKNNTSGPEKNPSDLINQSCLSTEPFRHSNWLTAFVSAKGNEDVNSFIRTSLQQRRDTQDRSSY